MRNFSEKNKPRVMLQTIINIVMIIYIVTFFIIILFFDNIYTVGIWIITGFIFVVISVIVCPECRTGKSSKIGITDMPDKGVNATE